MQGQVVEHIAGETDHHLQLQHQNHSLSRPGSVLSLVGGPNMSPTKKRPGSNLWRSQSCMSDLDQDSNQEMLAERDAKIRELEETVRLLKEKLSVCEKLPDPARPRVEGEEVPGNHVETIVEENSEDNEEED